MRARGNCLCLIGFPVTVPVSLGGIYLIVLLVRVRKNDRIRSPFARGDSQLTAGLWQLCRRKKQQCFDSGRPFYRHHRPLARLWQVNVATHAKPSDDAT